MNELLLVVRLADNRVAFPAAQVDSVVELDALIDVPRAPAHVAGLSALRSRVLTVIDCRKSLELSDEPGAAPGGVREAAVVELGGHHYALTVDTVEDVVEALGDPQPVRARMEAGWARVSRGTVETSEGPLLLVDLGALIDGPQAERAAA